MISAKSDHLRIRLSAFFSSFFKSPWLGATMRTRSQPVSPGGLVSLDDVAPRRRRTTRSASAQPQEAESVKPAEPLGDEAVKTKPARKARKTGGKSTRGKKASKQDTFRGSLD